MAKIEITNPNEDESRPASVETVAVRVWGLGGQSTQQFYIGSGLNFSAEGWRKNEQENYDKFVQDLPPEYPAPPPPDLTKIPANLAYCYAILARRTGEEDRRG